MFPLKVHVFSEQGDQTPMKTGGPGDLASQKAPMAASSEFFIQNSFKAPVLDSSVLKTTLLRTSDKPCTLPVCRDWTTNDTAKSPRT